MSGLSLRRLHAREREAHLNRDAALMASLFADDFVSVQDGEVTRPSREASRERFDRYFSRVEVWRRRDERWALAMVASTKRAEP